MAQTEIHPVRPGCRYLRARFRLQPSRKSPVPERIFQRHECEHGKTIEGDDAVYKCGITVEGCWQNAGAQWVTIEGVPTERPVVQQ